MAKYNREIVLFFMGNTMKFYVQSVIDEEHWKQVLDTAIDNALGGKATRLECGGTVFVVNHAFVGYQCRERQPDKMDRLLTAVEKQVDADEGESWR